jgi:hypothetical protein
MVDKESYIQETVEQLAMHTTNVPLIINLVLAKLTRKVHALILTINSYQAKAAKCVELSLWIPRSCKSNFTLSFPKDITEDDPELVKRWWQLPNFGRHYTKEETFLPQESCQLPTSISSYGYPGTKSSSDTAPYQPIQFQIVGLGLHRLLSLGCLQLCTDLDLYFNKEVTLPQRLAWCIQHLPIFKNTKYPECQIFKMYPYTKITWDKAEYIKLENTSCLTINATLKSFLSNLCKPPPLQISPEIGRKP